MTGPSSISLFGRQVFAETGLRQQLHEGGTLALLWRIDCAGPQSAAVLNAEEHRRAARFYFDRDRIAFQAARAGMRVLLGEWLGMPAVEVPLAVGERGKPCLDVARSLSSLHFNLSHSAGYAILALSTGCKVGVDLECVPADKPPPWKVANRCFVESEQAALQKGSESERRQAFYRLWTRKEAVVKLMGDGLNTPLQSFQVAADAEIAETISLLADNPLGLDACWLQSLPVELPRIAALATSKRPTSVVTRRLDFQSV